MLKLYVIRHGETEWNTEKRMQGRLDSQLTVNGRNDALLLGERLKEIEFKRIISSPSNRTKETANLVKGDSPTPIETDGRLLEISLGDWQGKTEDEIKELFPSQFHSYWNLPSRYENVKGENFSDVKERASSFLEELTETTKSGNVLVVTHGVVLKTLYLLCRNAEIDQIWDPPFIHGTSLTIIQIDNGKKELMLEACTAHCQ